MGGFRLIVAGLFVALARAQAPNIAAWPMLGGSAARSGTVAGTVGPTNGFVPDSSRELPAVQTIGTAPGTQRSSAALPALSSPSVGLVDGATTIFTVTKTGVVFGVSEGA